MSAYVCCVFSLKIWNSMNAAGFHMSYPFLLNLLIVLALYWIRRCLVPLSFPPSSTHSSCAHAFCLRFPSLGSLMQNAIFGAHQMGIPAPSNSPDPSGRWSPWSDCGYDDAQYTGFKGLQLQANGENETGRQYVTAMVLNSCNGDIKDESNINDRPVSLLQVEDGISASHPKPCNCMEIFWNISKGRISSTTDGNFHLHAFFRPHRD